MKLTDGCVTLFALQVLFDFVDSLDSTNYWRYSLVNSYPRAVFSQEEAASKSLTEAGLTPQAALFVQPDDDE